MTNDKPHFGKLAQLDAGFQGWLEEPGPRGCLLNILDDATSTTEARMGKEETIRDGGRRVASLDRPAWRATNLHEQKATSARAVAGRDAGHACWTQVPEAGIRIITASSPQVKGRVERNHGTHQDRTFKKLRRHGIASYEAANQFLQDEYLPRHNRRFAQSPAHPEDYDRRKLSRRELREIFSLETTRTIHNDCAIRYHGRYLQLEPGRDVTHGAKRWSANRGWLPGGLLPGRAHPASPDRGADPKSNRTATGSCEMRLPKKGKADHPWPLNYEMRMARFAAPPNVQRPSPAA